MRLLFAAAGVLVAGIVLAGAGPQLPPPARAVDVKSVDGLVLRCSYYAAGAPGPAVLLFHQSNRTRKSWEALASELAAAGIHTLTIDSRGYGETGGQEGSGAARRQKLRLDLDAVFEWLISQPGVKRDVVGIGGAGVIGVENSVETARRHSAQVKSLALLSGETDQDGLQFLHDASQLPELFVTADRDEYSPTVEAMELLYVTASSPSKKLVHYAAAEEAPWLWYEPFDVGKVPASGNHGTDLFATHTELPGIIVQWFVTTLVRTPGHAPADTLACAETIGRIREPGGGVAAVARQLTEARKKDPETQLFPEITVSIIGQDHIRAGKPKPAIEVLKLLVAAYPTSADAHETLAEAYELDGQKDLARRHAEKALALLDSHALPASSWTDTSEYRGEIRKGAQRVLEKIRKGS